MQQNAENAMYKRISTLNIITAFIINLKQTEANITNIKFY